MVSRRGSRLLVLVCLFVSVMSFNYALKFEQLEGQIQFRKLTLSSVSAINRRIRSYEQVLAGVGAYLGVTPDLTVADFEAFVDRLDLDEKSPGITGIGFIRSVAQPDVAATQQELSRAYGRAVTFTPETAFEDKLIVTHMAPQTLHPDMIGIDKGFEEGRRAALEAARQSRETVVVRRKPMAEDPLGEVEFLMARALFTAQGTPSEQFLGWVVAPFDAQMTMLGVSANLTQDYNLTLYSGGEADPEMVLYASSATSVDDGMYTHVYPTEQYGNTWFVQFRSTLRFDASYISYLPHFLLLVGLVFTVLVHTALKSMSLRHLTLKSLAELRMRQLGAREEENRALLETSVSVVLVVDGKGIIVFANEAAARLFACPAQELTGQPFDKYVQLNGDGDSTDLWNAHGCCAGGNKLLLDAQSNTWRTADGDMHATVMIRDVTEQINSRRAIEAVHKRYDIALTGAEIGIFEFELETGYAQMSETWHRIMGTDRLQVPFDHSTHFLGRVHPDDLPGLLECDRQCINGETPRSMAEYRVDFDGVWRWMYSDAVVIRDPDSGTPLKLIGTQSDITEVRHARNALEVSEARFRMVLEDAPVGMAVMEDSGAFVGANAALSRLCGYSIAELGSMRLNQLLSRRDFVKVSRNVRALLYSDDAKTYQDQLRLTTRSGEVRWGLFNLSWTFDKNRAANVYIAQIIDITGQKRIEQIKSEFVATVSHELRTPLTSIKGALGLLEVTAGDNFPASARRLIDIATMNADRLTAMVNDILDLERISSGDVAFELEDIPVAEIVSQSVQQATHWAGQHANTITVIEGEDVQVLADGLRIRQVMTNLLSNACKFSDENTVVTVSWEVQRDAAMFYVENIGAPVPESFRQQLFGAFTQLDASDTRNMGGTGLGLNIARQIVIRLGGDIGFEQYPDRRTVFWFTCPLAGADAASEIAAVKGVG